MISYILTKLMPLVYSMQNTVLQEFQEFLRTSSLVQVKYIPYYAYWSSKFLSFTNKNNELCHDLQVQKFLDELNDMENVAEWQIRQAHDAIRLYFNYVDSINCKDENVQMLYSQHDIKSLIDKVRQAIRIRHYSYRTGQEARK